MLDMTSMSVLFFYTIWKVRWKRAQGRPSDRAFVHSPGVQDPKPIRLIRIAINDLNWRPSPLPHTDARRAGELDLPAGAFDGNARPALGNVRAMHAARAQYIGEYDQRVVAFERDEGGRLIQSLAKACLDS